MGIINVSISNLKNKSLLKTINLKKHKKFNIINSSFMSGIYIFRI